MLMSENVTTTICGTPAYHLTRFLDITNVRPGRQHPYGAACERDLRTGHAHYRHNNWHSSVNKCSLSIIDKLNAEMWL